MHLNLVCLATMHLERLHCDRTNAGTEGGVYKGSGPSGRRAALVQFGYDGSSTEIRKQRHRSWSRGVQFNGSIKLGAKACDMSEVTDF